MTEESRDPVPAWDPTEFQAVVGAFLDRRDWSQNRLATELGISQTAVNRWFQPLDKTGPGRVTRPRPDVLVRLAAVMRYPLSDLLRICDYPVTSGRQHRPPSAVRSLTTMIEAAYEATDDPERRRIGIDAIEALVQSVFSGHARRRTGRPRQPQHSDDATPESLRVLSYA